MKEIEKEFLRACSNGNINILEYLLKQLDDINIHMYEELPFRIACKNGQMEVVKYLFSVNPNINISSKNEQSFLISCINQDIELGEYLLSLKPEIVESMYLDTQISIPEHAFITACKNGN